MFAKKKASFSPQNPLTARRMAMASKTFSGPFSSLMVSACSKQRAIPSLLKSRCPIPMFRITRIIRECSLAGRFLSRCKAAAKNRSEIHANQHTLGAGRSMVRVIIDRLYVEIGRGGMFGKQASVGADPCVRPPCSAPNPHPPAAWKRLRRFPTRWRVIRANNTVDDRTGLRPAFRFKESFAGLRIT